MSREFSIYIEEGFRRLIALKESIKIVKRIARFVRDIYPDAKVYFFGSALKGKYTAMSDIDILVVIDGISKEEMTKLKAKIIMKFFEYPIEVHMINTSKLFSWYTRFIDKMIEV